MPEKRTDGTVPCDSPGVGAIDRVERVDRDDRALAVDRAERADRVDTVPSVECSSGSVVLKTPISLLQERCSARGLTPQYQLLTHSGTVHTPMFVFSCAAGGFNSAGKGCTTLTSPLSHGHDHDTARLSLNNSIRIPLRRRTPHPSVPTLFSLAATSDSLQLLRITLPF